MLMPAGSVMVFDDALMHLGGANNSDTDRLAITSNTAILAFARSRASYCRSRRLSLATTESAFRICRATKSLNPALWVTWMAYTRESLLTVLTEDANIAPIYRPRDDYRCP